MASPKILVYTERESEKQRQGDRGFFFFSILRLEETWKKSGKNSQKLCEISQISNINTEDKGKAAPV